MFNTNKFLERQDYELAEECWKGIEALLIDLAKGNKPEDRSYPELMHLEGIFLDLTDRTQAHPRVPFGTEERGGFFENFVKDLGFGNRKVVWKFTEMFNVDKYVQENWFVSTLEMDNAYFDEMTKAKELYGIGKYGDDSDQIFYLGILNRKLLQYPYPL